MLNMLNLFFTKESSSEDHTDSGFETLDIPEGDDGFFFLEFSIKFHSENEFIFWVLVGLWMSLFCLLLPSLPVNLSESTDQCMKVL